VGEILFKNRGWIPFPFLAVAVYFTLPLSVLTGLGLSLVPLGLLVRLWGLIHMGPQARSRTAVVEKLIYTGPYELSRNPLYIANIALYSGIGLATLGLLGWGASLGLAVVYYNLIVRYEEAFLEQRLGEIYRSYRNRVPRWFGEAAPVHAAAPKGRLDERFSAALRAERTTLLFALFVTTLVLLRASLPS